MRAFKYRYTIKIIEKGWKEIKITYSNWFKNSKIFQEFLNHKNALSLGDIYYCGKKDKAFNRKSIKINVPSRNFIYITKHSKILVT